MSTALDTALEALRVGLSPVPPVEDGSKRPLADLKDDDGRPTWKPYSTRAATEFHVRGWFKDGRQSIGLATGYNGLECLEFDCRDTHGSFIGLAGEAGLAEIVDRIRSGYEEYTPGGGVHWLYYCDGVKGNTKLAERPDLSDPAKRQVLIETRGAGGFVIIAPSNGMVHPTGGAYKLVSGGLRTIPTLLSCERDELWDFAKSFDEMQVDPKPDPHPFRPKTPSEHSKFPDEVKSAGDDYTERTSWEDILEPHGWVKVYIRGDATYWRRPGKDRGISARTGGRWRGLKVWSTSTPFLTTGTHTKFGAYTLLNHNGDFTAATRALGAAGFGTRKSDQHSTTQEGGSAGFGGTSSQVSPNFQGVDLKPIAVELRPVPRLDIRMIPTPFRFWVADIASRGCFPLEYVAATLLVSLSGLVGRKIAIKPKRQDDWKVIGNLWGAIVGQPGYLKTPAVEEVLRPLRRLAADALQVHSQAMAEWEGKCLIAMAKKSAAKKALEQGAKNKLSDAELADLARDATTDHGETEPNAKRYLVNDTTVEKLGELLAENPSGLTLFRDELVGFLRTLDRQGHESDRAFFLEAWNGSNSFTFDRIGRGTIHIPNVCLALFGTIQPGPLAKYLKASLSGEEADGFVPRFQVLLYPDPPEKFVNVDRWPDSESKNRAYAIFQALDRLDPAAMGCDVDQDSGIPFLRFAGDAQDFFDQWRVELENRLRSQTLSNIMASHLAKYRSLMPSLALQFHLINLSDQTSLGPVSLEAAMTAAAWCELLEAHARRVYEFASEGDPDDAIRLAEKIKTSIPNPFRYRDVYKKGWTGLTTPEEVSRAVGILEDRGWVKVVEKPTTERGGRPTEEVWINPQVLSETEEVHP
jgi:putative DNA primase/helicase